jgi:hypothetical protein
MLFFKTNLDQDSYKEIAGNSGLVPSNPRCNTAAPYFESRGQEIVVPEPENERLKINMVCGLRVFLWRFWQFRRFWRVIKS